jgi:hypothetical protein
MRCNPDPGPSRRRGSTGRARALAAFLVCVLLLLPQRALPSDLETWFHPERHGLGGHGGPWAKPTTLDGAAGVMGGGPCLIAQWATAAF